MGALTLVLGGARSGKSTFAEQLAQREGGDAVLYVATAEAGDEEMARRIQVHRRSRPATWQTMEAPRDVGQAVRNHDEVAVVLLDCLTLLVSNCMNEAGDPFTAAVTARIQGEIDQLLCAVRDRSAHFIVVSNEVGMGLVPSSPLGRAYRDHLGRANQTLAQAADTVILMVAGLPLFVKGEALP